MMRLDTHRMFLPLVYRGTFTALVWLGFALGVDGAQNVARFVVWAVSQPLGMLARIARQTARRRAVGST